MVKGEFLEENRMLKCKACRRSTSLNSLKYEPDGSLVCGGCFDKKRGIARIMKKEGEKPKKLNVNNTNYVCKKCKYEFSKKEDYQYKILCPYCNSDNVAKRADMSANSLIKEVGDRGF